MLSSPHIVPTFVLAATSLTGCLDFGAQDAEASNGMNSIAEQIAAQATTQIQLVANLDATQSEPQEAWNLQDPSGSANFSTHIEIFDVLGERHGVDIFFRRSGASQFDYFVVVAGQELAMPSAGNAQVGAGTLTFDTDGALLKQTASQELCVLFANTEEEQKLTLDLGSTKEGGGTGTDGLTQYARPNNVSYQSQDGHTGGRFAGVELGRDDVAYALYTNGCAMAILGANAA